VSDKPTTPKPTTGELPELPKNPPDAQTGLDYWREKAFWDAAKRRRAQLRRSGGGR
jgi:hypothetical protein